MEYLRKYIRKLLIESPELQDELDELVHNRESVPYSVGGGTQHEEYAKDHVRYMRGSPSYVESNEHPWPTEPEIEESFDFRREVKKFWNEYADHSFWQNPKSVLAIHDLTYYAEFAEEDEVEFSEEYKRDTDLKIESFFKKYPPGVIQKDEMSTYGYLDLETFLERDSRFQRIGLAVLLNPRRVTWASKMDAHTESRSEASPADIIKHAGSGLPKRPNISKTFSAKSVLFDKRDISRSGIGELVVDNWAYDTLIINTGYNKRFSVKRVKQIIKIAKEHGLKVIDGRHGEEL